MIAVKDIYEMPGHLVRRFQQIAVAIFHAEVGKTGFDLTPVQYVALASVIANPGIDQATLAGLIFYDRTTIGGVVDRLVQKQMLARHPSDSDRRAYVLHATDHGLKTMNAIEGAVIHAQKMMLGALDQQESAELIRLLRKAVDTAPVIGPHSGKATPYR